MWKEFREFIMRGNVLDLAIAVVIGAAFGAIVSSLVTDILTPIIGLALGQVDFTNLFLVLADPTNAGPYTTLADAQAAGAVTVNIGLFLNAVINFLIVAFVIFQVVRAANRMKRREAPAPAAPATKECPYCLSTIPLKATRCPNCTSQLTA